MPRQEERVQYLEEVELNFASGKRTARISDISMGGCYVDSIAAVPVGEPVSIEITRSSGENVQFNGRVAYILEGFGFGVEFIDLTDDQVRFLERMVGSGG
jgi:hypothetical protein